MQGQIDEYQTAHGKRYRARVSLGSGRDRKQPTKRGFKKKSDAERWVRKQIGAIEDNTHVPYDRVTVRDYLLEEWLPSIAPRRRDARGHRGAVGVQSWETYRADVERYVVPRIGHLKLQALAPRDLNRLYDELESDPALGRGGGGLSGKTLENLHGVLHKALDDAVKAGRVARNVANAVEAPRAERAHTEVWTVEQLRAYLTHVADDRWYAAWLLFATTGMRRGEVAALAWEDLDLDAGHLRVSWTLGHTRGKATWKNRAKSKAGERTISLDPATVEALRAWRAQQAEERLACGPGWVEVNTDWRGSAREGCLWTWPDGKVVHPNLWTKWHGWNCDGAALPRIRLHDVRHTYATAALANASGWHEVKVISERLGHKSVGVTLDTYSHVLPAADEQVAHSLSRHILGG